MKSRQNITFAVFYQFGSEREVRFRVYFIFLHAHQVLIEPVPLLHPIAPRKSRYQLQWDVAGVVFKSLSPSIPSPNGYKCIRKCTSSKSPWYRSGSVNSCRISPTVVNTTQNFRPRRFCYVKCVTRVRVI